MLELESQDLSEQYCESEPVVERRQSERHRTTYRPCCIIGPDKVTMGLIRNSSAGGARIEADGDFAVGQTVSYFWDVNRKVSAKIVWRDGNTYGVQHLVRAPSTVDDLPPRSVRVPCQAEAVCWVDGMIHTALVENISFGGLRLVGLPQLEVGQLISVELCNLDLGMADVRWQAGARSGLCLSKRLSREKIADLLLNESFGLSQIAFETDADGFNNQAKEQLPC